MCGSERTGQGAGHGMGKDMRQVDAIGRYIAQPTTSVTGLEREGRGFREDCLELAVEVSVMFE